MKHIAKNKYKFNRCMYGETYSYKLKMMYSYDGTEMTGRKFDN